MADDEANRRARLNRPDRPLNRAEAGNQSLVVKILSTAANIAVGKYFLARIAQTFGPEVEGGVPTFTTAGASFPVLLLGPDVPPSGSYIQCTFERQRWVATFKAGGGPLYTGPVGIANCVCPSLPINLAMTSADPNCNFAMFQSCTIRYGPTPSSLVALNLGSNIYLSTATFPDPVANGAQFYYYLACSYNQFSLTRVYPTSPMGNPFRDGILYTWLVGGYGNTCNFGNTPFKLHSGAAYPGSDTTCHVEIDQA